MPVSDSTIIVPTELFAEILYLVILYVSSHFGDEFVSDIVKVSPTISLSLSSSPISTFILYVLDNIDVFSVVILITLKTFSSILMYFSRA